MGHFSYQLYSSRNHGPLADTLVMLGKLGYKQVEGFGGLFSDDTDLGAFQAQLESNGLHMASCHLGLEMVRDQPQRAIEIANALNIEAVFVPAIPEDERVQSAAGWEALGKTLAEIGAPLQDAGLAFGWHNHAFEFASVDSEQLPLDLILAGSDSLQLELDVAWAVVGKQNPLLWIEKYADRLIAAHVKDIAKEGECIDEDGWADVGHGVVNWPTIMAALKQHQVKYFVMEHDNPNDHQRFASRSIAAAQAL